MAMRFSDTGVEAMVNAMAGKADVGTAGAAQFQVFSGARPATLDGDLDTQVLLVAFDLPNPAFLDAVESTGTTSGWSAALDTDHTDPADATDGGVAAWFRLVDRDGDPVLDGTVSILGGGGDAIISTVTVADGVSISLVGFTYTQPKGW